jgi:hypothetical protein
MVEEPTDEYLQCLAVQHRLAGNTYQGVAEILSYKFDKKITAEDVKNMIQEWAKD